MKIIKFSKTEFVNLLYFLILSIAGYFLARESNFFLSFSTSTVYEYLINFILAIGLYASVSAINTSSLREDKKIIFKAVTLGVMLKILIIFTIMYFKAPTSIEAFMLAIIVAQIDPLSVSAILRHDNSILSERAETIIRAWSSFDDPVTAFLAILIATFYLDTSTGWHINIITLISFIILGIAFFFYRRNKFSSATNLLFFITFLLLATLYQQFFAIAISGLFIRTKDIKNIIKKVLPCLYHFSIALMGMKLVYGINIIDAIILAGAAVCSQIIVGYIMTKNFPIPDRWFISFSQQNGLTAIILSLLLLKYDPQFTSIVAPAILLINILHMFSNTIINNGIKMKKPSFIGRSKKIKNNETIRRQYITSP
jgi:hypothetical protein